MSKKTPLTFDDMPKWYQELTYKISHSLYATTDYEPTLDKVLAFQKEHEQYFSISMLRNLYEHAQHKTL